MALYQSTKSSRTIIFYEYREVVSIAQKETTIT